MTTMIDSRGRTAEERAALQEKIDKINEEAQKNWGDPAWHREMAQVITENIYFGFQHENLLQLLTQVENVSPGARVTVKETRGLRAFWIALGGYIESSMIRSDVMEIPGDWIGFHVYDFEDKIRDNFAETQSTLIDLGIQRLDAEVNLRVLKTFQAAIPSTSPYYITGAGLSLAALNTALREVRDESLSDQISIVGRATMIDQIGDELISGNYAAFLPETNEELLARGVIGRYRGARLVTLKNYKDDEDTPFFPANELFVIGQDASKFAFWGGLESKEFVEDDNWYWHYLARRRFGGVISRPERARRIHDSSIDA